MRSILSGSLGRGLLLAGLAVGVAGAAPSAFAQPAPPGTAAAPATPGTPVAPEDGWTYDLAHELMSPFCPGRTLATCPSPQASELIQWIALQEASGASRDEVEAILIERYGEQMLASPPAEGIGLWAYLLPVAGFLVGGAIVWLVLRRIVGGGQRPSEIRPGPRAASDAAPETSGAPPRPAPGHDDDVERLVDAELARRA